MPRQPKQVKVGDRVSWDTRRRKYREEPTRTGIILGIRTRTKKLTQRRKMMGYIRRDLEEMSEPVACVREEGNNMNWRVPLRMCVKVSGTVKPLELIEMLPDDIEAVDYFHSEVDGKKVSKQNKLLYDYLTTHLQKKKP